MTAASVGVLTAVALAPLSLLSTWLLLGTLTVGVGLLARRAFGPGRGFDADALFAAFWMGVCTITLGLHIWHFFLPVSGVTGALIVVLGLAGIVVGVREWLSRSGATSAGRPRAALVVALLIGWWLGDQALGEVASFDTTMYHVPAVEWLRAHALVPGLANLHGRFGFNNSSFLLAALLEAGLWRDGSVLLLNGVFVSAGLARSLHAMARWPRVTGAARVQSAVDLVLLAPILGIVVTPALFRSLNADVPAAMALFAGLSLLAGRIARPERDRAGAEAAVTAVLAFTVAVAFKLSVALVAFPAWLIAMRLLARDPAMGDEHPLRPAAVALALSGVLIGTWLARGIVLSGYPLYPATALGVQVDWRVPAEQAAAESAWIRFFARTWHAPGMYNAVETSYLCRPAQLIGSWVRSLFRMDVLWQVVVPAALAAVFAPVVLLRRSNGVRTGSFMVWLGALMLACVLWLALAPRPLFGFAMFWSLAAISAGFAVQGMARAGGAHAGRADRRAPIFAALLALLPIAGAMLEVARNDAADPVRAAIGVVYTAPDADAWFIPTRWEYPATTYVTRSGLELLVPTGHRCGRAPIPCTSHPAANLRLRRPGDLSGGFAVDGDWQAERFPSPFTNFLEVWRATRSGSGGDGCAS